MGHLVLLDILAANSANAQLLRLTAGAAYCELTTEGKMNDFQAALDKGSGALKESRRYPGVGGAAAVAKADAERVARAAHLDRAQKLMDTANLGAASREFVAIEKPVWLFAATVGAITALVSRPLTWKLRLLVALLMLLLANASVVHMRVGFDFFFFGRTLVALLTGFVATHTRTSLCQGARRAVLRLAGRRRSPSHERTAAHRGHEASPHLHDRGHGHGRRAWVWA